MRHTAQPAPNAVTQLKNLETEFLEAALTVIATKAALKMVSATVDHYQTALLENKPWYTSPEYGEVRLVTNHKDTTWMTDADANLYHSLCSSAAHAAGYRTPQGKCPKLIMQNKLRDAENTLIDVHAPITGLTSQLAATNPNLRTQALELALNLAGGQPGFTREAAMPKAISIISELKPDKGVRQGT